MTNMSDFNSELSVIDYDLSNANCSSQGPFRNEELCEAIQNISQSLNTSCNTTDCSESTFLLPWYQQLFWYLLFGNMVIVAAGGNLIVIYIVLADRRMRSVTNIFLVNLSIADAMNATLNVVFNFTYMLNNLDWPFGLVYCKINQFVSVLSISASVLTLMAISFDRYWAIIYPLRTRIGLKATLFIVVGIWLASVAISAPNVLFFTTQVILITSGLTRTICFPNWADEEMFIYNILILIITYILPIMCMGATYTRMGLLLWGSRGVGEQTPGQWESMRAKRKVVKMMIVVVTIFGVCWLPFHLYFILSTKYPEINNYEHMQSIYLFIYWLAMSNSMYNPIIYCWLNDKFRNGFKSVFYRWCPCISWLKPSPGLRPGPTITTYYSSNSSPDFARRCRNAQARPIAMQALSNRSTPSTVTTRYHNGHSTRSSSLHSSINPSLESASLACGGPNILDPSTGNIAASRQYQVQLRHHQQYQQHKIEQHQKQMKQQQIEKHGLELLNSFALDDGKRDQTTGVVIINNGNVDSNLCCQREGIKSVCNADVVLTGPSSPLLESPPDVIPLNASSPIKSVAGHTSPPFMDASPTLEGKHALSIETDQTGNRGIFSSTD